MENSITSPERITQNKVIRFFKDTLNYQYLGNLSDAENTNIRKNDLIDFLTNHMKYSSVVANKAYDELVKTANNLQQGLYYANKEVYTLLKYGVKVKENPEDSPKTVFLIDFNHAGNNIFSIAEEVTVVGNNEKRPDLVIYLNGIAVAVFELKRSAISVADGIRQNLTNQREMFIKEFFTTIQFCLAGNESEGLKYGTINTPEKEYLVWKEDRFKENADEINEIDASIVESLESIDNKLLKSIYSLFYKTRFLNLIHNFIIFDKGSKKVCRYNQYFGIMRAQKRLQKGNSGIIWHTQGSGKSLTMVWLSKWIISNLPKSRVLIITDRDELDEQIEKLYKGVNESVVRTKSGADLLTRINGYEDRLICSLVHKFGKRGGEATENDLDKYVEELISSLPKNFEAKDNFYVFVDECHRTQSGKLNKAMKAILPNAIFVGFTGTPLLKKDKKTSIEVFGTFIHTYKYNEGVEDGIVLDLKYEARDIPQDLTTRERVDAWFDAKTAGLLPAAKAKLKEKWANMQTVYGARSRLEKIANDIIFDFGLKERLKNGKGNAILVADSIYSACKYYEIFINSNFKKCAIISSYSPNKGDLRTGAVDEDADTEPFYKYNTYLKMIGVDPNSNIESEKINSKVEEFEKEAKRKFIEEPANMKLLIVVDKLLTGFDAHSCTYLYIDKSMHDHGLFQAVCRVNRLDDESKEFGYIVDYKQLFGDLNEAMQTYNSVNPFEGYDEEDVKGLLTNRKEETKKHFYEMLDTLDGICEGVEQPRGQLEYEHYFCGENGLDLVSDEAKTALRDNLYSFTNKLIRAYADFAQYESDLGLTDVQREKNRSKVAFYTELKAVIGRASGDFIDLKAYEPDMRYLIDTYVVASDSIKIYEFDDFTLLDFINSQEDNLKSGDSENTDARKKGQSSAETIENNIAKEVVERKVINPKYYEKISSILTQLIEDRKNGVIAYKDLLLKYIELVKNIKNPEENSRYPDSIRKSGAMRALYDNFGEDENLTLMLHQAVLRSKMDAFRDSPVRARQIQKELYKILKNKDKVEEVYKIIVMQEEY